jgi:hypothetical protein
MGLRLPLRCLNRLHSLSLSLSGVFYGDAFWLLMDPDLQYQGDGLR